MIWFQATAGAVFVGLLAAGVAGWRAVAPPPQDRSLMDGAVRSGERTRVGEDERRDAPAAGAARCGQEERDARHARHARALARLDLGLDELRHAIRAVRSPGPGVSGGDRRRGQP